MWQLNRFNLVSKCDIVLVLVRVCTRTHTQTHSHTHTHTNTGRLNFPTEFIEEKFNTHISSNFSFLKMPQRY